MTDDALRFFDFVEIWNGQQQMRTPAHHRRIAGWLEDNWTAGNRHLLLMAFRGSGKSTLVGLFAAWLLHTAPERRLMVLAADLALAKKMVRNVKRIIERHPATQALKPADRDQWAAEQFTVVRPVELRDPSMIARGIDGNITGSRADIIICDDVEVPRTCDSAPKRADLRDKLAEIDFVLVPGGTQLYVGTPHTYYTLYADIPRPEVGEDAPFLDGFTRLVLPVLDADGASAWPERFPPAHIERIRRRTGALKFDSQMMLRPTNLTVGRLDPDRLRPYDGELAYHESGGRAVLTLNGVRLVSASAWWDPAFARAQDGRAGDGQAAGDASVIAAVFTGEDGNAYLHRALYLCADPAAAEDEATQQCRAVAAFLRDFHLPGVHLEINGLGRFLPGVLRRELGRARLAAAVVEVASRRPKALRIVEAFDARLAGNSLFAHRSVWDTPFVREMREWRPDARYRGRDDGLDAVAGCLSAEPMRFDRSPPARPRGDWRRAETVVAPSEWPV